MSPVVSMELPGRGGDCYVTALRALVSVPTEGVLLCHGEPIGTGPANRGKRFGHAWIEIPQPDGSWVAVDPHGVHEDAPWTGYTRESYYRAGGIVADDVTRYTIDEVRAMFDRYRTAGPWPAEIGQVRDGRALEEASYEAGVGWTRLARLAAEDRKRST